MSKASSIYWFRNDLRLHDNRAFLHAIHTSDFLLPVYCHDDQNQNKLVWNFPRCSPLRTEFVLRCLDDLKNSLEKLNSGLLECTGDAVEQLIQIAQQTNIQHIICEAIQAPEELSQVARLRSAGLQVTCIWQSSLLLLEDLPFSAECIPDVFTAFRNSVEKSAKSPQPALETPNSIPPTPSNLSISCQRPHIQVSEKKQSNSSFPFHEWKWCGETQALLQINSYFASTSVKEYKQTRNQLTGWSYSTKFSPWLACGAISPRMIYQLLKQHEAEHGESEGSYWIWFELLWRDYFRFLHFKYGQKLYRDGGLTSKKLSHINSRSIDTWRLSQSGQNLIDAAMNELCKTGFLSNRLRQIVASYFLYNMQGDWRAGAAWFESQLLDYDVYSNQGNWLYIAGLGTDPRGGRQFDVNKQQRLYDPEGEYIEMWIDH